MITCTYYQQEQVIAFARHETNGEYKNVLSYRIMEKMRYGRLYQGQYHRQQIKDFVEIFDEDTNLDSALLLLIIQAHQQPLY